MAFSLAEEKLGISSLLDVEDVVRPRIPDRFSILTYLSQFYHKFASSGSDSGISSVGQTSPVSSDRVSANGVRRKMSLGEKRGAIRSLMDGRRARSMSSQGRVLGRNSPSSLHHDNPFKGDSKHTEQEYFTPHKAHKQTNPIKQTHKRNLVEKYKKDHVCATTLAKIDSQSASVPPHMKKGNSNHTEQEYFTPRKKAHKQTNPIKQTHKRNQVEKYKKDHVCATTLAKTDSQSASVPPHMKKKKLLSLTTYPKPYQSIEVTQTTSLLSQTQSYLQQRKCQRSHSQPANIRNTVENNKLKVEYSKSMIQDPNIKKSLEPNSPISVEPPPKPRRTFATEARNLKNLSTRPDKVTVRQCQVNTKHLVKEHSRKTQTPQDPFLQTL